MSGPEKTIDKRKKLFTKEVTQMMYGFGDEENPLQESVDLVEFIVIEYITEMTKLAAALSQKNRIKKEELLFVIRKDRKKYNRATQLLDLNEKIKKARKLASEDGTEP